MHVQSLAQLSFCNSTSLTDVIIPCPCSPRLPDPVWAVVSFVSAAPSWISLRRPVIRFPLSKTGTVAKSTLSELPRLTNQDHPTVIAWSLDRWLCSRVELQLSFSRTYTRTILMLVSLSCMSMSKELLATYFADNYSAAIGWVVFALECACVFSMLIAALWRTIHMFSMLANPCISKYRLAAIGTNRIRWALIFVAIAAQALCEYLCFVALQTCIHRVSIPENSFYVKQAGSGSLPIECKRLGRNFIASEIKPDIAAQARERLAAVQAIDPVFLEEQSAFDLDAA